MNNIQLYVLDRGFNTLATTSRFYNDNHHKELFAGSSIFNFDIDKTDPAAEYMTTGNYITMTDDRGKPWSFTILEVTETHTTKTVEAYDVGIELINKQMDIWTNSGAHPFSYYFDQVTKDTPWELGVNQLSELNRALVFEGRDTGLGRLLSILKGFDDAECQFAIEMQGNRPVKFTVNVYKHIGVVQDNVQIIYSQQLNDITKTESRAAFVTALEGVGGVIEPEDGTVVDATAPQQNVDFADLVYKDDNFETTKGDKFLRAVTANRTFNPGDKGYIESFYEYDTQSSQELLNRTLSQLATYSEPQYKYEADVKVIDPVLDIGDTVTMLDHDYNPALYLSARVASLDKSYTDSTQGTVTFTNYQVLTSTIANQLQSLQKIVNSLPTGATINAITSNLTSKIDELSKKLAVVVTSADGNHNLYINNMPSNAKEGDTAFMTLADGSMEIHEYKDGVWTLSVGLATAEQIKNAVQQATADIKTAQDTANSAVETAESVAKQFEEQAKTVDSLNTAVGEAKTNASDALTSANKAKTDAATALTNASAAQMDAASALKVANGASSEVITLKQTVDATTATIATLATQKSVDTVNGTVTELSTQTKQNATDIASKADQSTVDTINQTVTSQGTLISQNATAIKLTAKQTDVDTLTGTVKSQGTTIDQTVAGLKLKADQATVDGINGNVTKLSTQINTQADQIKLMATKTELTNATSGLATQNYVDSQLSVEAEKINSTVQSVQTQVNASAVGTNLLTDSSFESGSIDTVQYQFANRTTLSVSSDYAYQGTYCLKNYLSNTLNRDTGPVIVKKTLSANTNYTFSAWAYSKTAITLSLVAYSNQGWSSNNRIFISIPATTWTRISITFITDSSGNGGKVGIYKQNNNDMPTFYLDCLKLEKGTVATDWCPNPADNATVTALTSVTQTLTQIQQMATDNKGNLTTLTTTVNGNQTSVTNSIKGLTTQQTTLAGQYTSVAKSVDGLSTKLTQTVSDVNLRVQKNDVINQINISKESILIGGNKVHITGQTTIDSGIITNAMIANATIDGAKIKDASIMSAKIGTIDGGKIAAGTVTASQLSADAIAVGFNNYFDIGVRITEGGIELGESGQGQIVLQGDGINFGGSNPSSITVDSSHGGIKINGMQSSLTINTLYASDADGLGLWISRKAGAGISLPGIRILNANQNSGLFFDDDGTFWLGEKGKWKRVFQI